MKKKNEVHLVLTEFHLLGLARSFSIEKIRESSKMPFFVMSSDDTEFFLAGALSTWGKSHSKTPVVIADLKALWRFGTLIKKNIEKIASEGVCGFLGNQSQKGKQRGKELLCMDDIGENTELPVPKKQRLAWTDDLIRRFVATFDVPEAEKERTLSYLQEKDAMQEYGAFILPDLQLGSHLLSRTSGCVENLIPYIDQLFVSYGQDSSSNLLTDSSSSLPMHYLSPAQLVSEALSSSYDSRIYSSQ